MHLSKKSHEKIFRGKWGDDEEAGVLSLPLLLSIVRIIFVLAIHSLNLHEISLKKKIPFPEEREGGRKGGKKEEGKTHKPLF